MNIVTRWPAAQFRALSSQLGQESVCANCRRFSLVWFQDKSRQEIAELDEYFPSHMEQLFFYVYYPQRLWTTEKRKSCDPCKIKYGARCQQFLDDNPQNALAPLLSCVSAIPAWEIVNETTLAKARRTEREKLCALGQLLAYSYLSSTKVVDSFPERPEEGDIIGTHDPILFGKVKALALTLDKATLAKLQRTALLRFHRIMDLFDRVDAQKDKVIKIAAKTATAAVGSVAVGVGTSIFASPLSGVMIIVPAYGMFKNGIEIATWDFSDCNPCDLNYASFSPSVPKLTYGFNPSSSGPWGRLKGLVVDNPSQTYGFVKLQLDKDYFFLFNLNHSEPLAPGVVWQMAEYLKQGLAKGLLTLENVRNILQTLSRATLAQAPATHPKLISPKTGAYLSSLILEHLLETEDEAKERVAARKLIEESIASNLMTTWPEAENRLQVIVQNFEKKPEQS